MLMDLGPLEKLAGRNHGVEAIGCREMVFPPVELPRARKARGRGNRKRQVRLGRHELARQRGLPAPEGLEITSRRPRRE